MEPRVIKSEDEYRSVLGEVEKLVRSDPELGTPQGDRLELFALLIENYEKSRFQFTKPDPIEAILFRMNEQGLRQTDLVSYFGSRSRVSEVLARKRPLTVQMVREISTGLGISASVLVADPLSHEPAKDLQKDIDWTKFPAKEMAKQGYFDDALLAKKSLSELAREFYTKILEPSDRGLILTRRTPRGDAINTRSEYALLAWKARVIDLARARKRSSITAAYSPNALDAAFLNQVAQLSWNANGIRAACELIEGIGIPVVVEPRLAGTYLDGASMLDRDGTPIIGLTIRIDRVDSFWFTLLHELAHVMKHLSAPGDTFLDRLEDRESVEDLEAEANRVARDALIPRAAWRRADLGASPSKQRVIDFAKQLHIHPAIVAGRVRRETGNFRMLNDLVGAHEVRRHFAEVSFE